MPGAEDLAGEAKELAVIALEKFLLAHPALSFSTKGEVFGKRLQTSPFENCMGVEQKSDTDEEDAIIVNSPSLTNFYPACPFYISQKEEHRSCLTRFNLRDIKSLKWHLETEHLQPSYCPTCHDTFASTGDWEAHIRRRSCVPSGKPRPEGISTSQVQQLAQLDNLRLSRELQWLSIWEIVFPGVKPPSLSISSSTIETAVWVLRDFWSTQGSGIVSSFLTEKQLHLDELHSMTLGSLALDLVVDQVVGMCTQEDNDS
ncbi:hypothetical protein O1611_g3943 [Lasiodiplodia mahajangana]|uniref:Uncharacterized protein n=1 Tax=Lasiodiplodia mahajangana TaxID=1108764 RepID=A0ACC2JR01_9PEZI|nr:hypothetical protein O1611_g3943 [Lasiodiplodia mahajangana]